MCERELNTLCIRCCVSFVCCRARALFTGALCCCDVRFESSCVSCARLTTTENKRKEEKRKEESNSKRTRKRVPAPNNRESSSHHYGHHHHYSTLS